MRLTLAGLNEKSLDLILRFGVPCDTLKGLKSDSLLYLPYGLVRITIPTLQASGKLDDIILSIMRHQHGEDFTLDGATANEILAFYLFVKKELERIQQIERHFLGGDPDIELLAAGVRRLDEFGALATVHALAGDDILKHDAVEALPYFKVYQVMKLNKTHGEINKRYNEIIHAKNTK